MSSVAKRKQQPGVSLFGSMFQAGLYKPQQGRIVRQVTAVSIAVIMCLIALNCARFSFVEEMFSSASFVVGLTLSAIGVWFSYRVVNYPPFADFLIAVEAEMKKVSWPAWPQLWRASLVVIFVIFSMALSLWLFDLFWTKVFQLLGIR